jgi:hypothetical protein
MPDERAVGFSRIVPQTRRLPIGDSPFAIAAKSTRQLLAGGRISIMDTAVCRGAERLKLNTTEAIK